MARPRTCSVKYFCLGAFLIFLGSVLLCALGFTIVLPHEATRLWPEVTCHVTNTSYDRDQCACDQQVMEYKNCIEKYPCLRISVIFNISHVINLLLDDTSANLTALRNKLEQYNDKEAAHNNGYKHRHRSKDKEAPHDRDYKNTMVRYHNEGNITRTPAFNNGLLNHETNATNNRRKSDISNSERNLKENIRNGLQNYKVLILSGMLYRRWSDSFHKTCALYECGDELWNVKEVRRFQREWGQPGQTFPCFFDPEFPDVAVIQRTSKAQAVHAILWPAISLFTGSLIWMGMCLGCWKIEIEQPQNSSTYYRGIL